MGSHLRGPMAGRNAALWLGRGQRSSNQSGGTLRFPTLALSRSGTEGVSHPKILFPGPLASADFIMDGANGCYFEIF